MTISAAARRASNPSPRRASPERLYRGVANTERVAERRARFITAGIECFGRDGFHATTLKALCTEAGLTERYFYESFSSFSELLCESYKQAAAETMARVREGVKTAEPTPEARMRAGLTAYLKKIAANPARARLLLLEIEGASPEADAVYRAELRAWSDLIRYEVCEGLPGNPNNGLSPSLLASAMMGALYQLAKVWVLEDFKLPRKALVDNAQAMFVGTITEWQRPAPPAGAVRAPRGSTR
jgi:AcrR family transcriptional regulator